MNQMNQIYENEDYPFWRSWMLAGGSTTHPDCLWSYEWSFVQEGFALEWPGSGCGHLCHANIAEGFVRHFPKEFVQFLFIAMSSAAEVQSHLYVALDQGYIEQKEFAMIYEQANKTARIISGLITYLRTKSTEPTRPTK